MFLQSPILSYNYRFSVSEHDEHPPDWLQLLTSIIDLFDYCTCSSLAKLPFHHGLETDFCECLLSLISNPMLFYVR